jgi:putative ABC transport system permease protein
VAVRTKGVPLETVIGAVRSEMSAVDPDLPVRDLMTAQMVVDRQTGQLLFIGKLVAGFAALGAFLAGLGIYGVIARTVAQRTGEIGIRMALGARITDIVKMVLASGIRLALGGAAIGFLGAFALGRLLHSTLPSMETNSSVVLVATATLLAAIAVVACYTPARKAARINPVEALRAE